jgi:hypothetical protein
VNKITQPNEKQLNVVYYNGCGRSSIRQNPKTNNGSVEYSVQNSYSEINLLNIKNPQD